MTSKPNPGLPLGSRRQRRSPNSDDYAKEIVGLRTASDAVIYQHVFGSADREVGGVLVGRMAADGGLPLVTGAIPAISADEQRATLTFTQESWAHVHRTLDTEFSSDDQIVGWYHSHPGFGIFLSSHDLFIHENFFGAPSQIAMVIDPHAQREGVFVWQSSDLTILFERATPPGWIAARAEPEQSIPGRGATAQGGSNGSEQNGYLFLALAIAAVIGVVIGFGLWSLVENGASAKVPQAAPARVERPKPAPTPESHIEVLGEGARSPVR